MNKVVFVIIALLSTYLAYGQEYEIDNRPGPEVTVPDSVLAAFHRIAPIANDIEWRESDSTLKSYEVGFDHNGLHCDAEFDSVGMILECRTEVEIAALPPIVRKAILRKISREWAKHPIAVIRILATAHCERGSCIPFKWLVLTYSSDDAAKIDERSDHFLISKTGHVSEPQFR